MNTFTIFLVLITIVSLLLIIVIMIQNPKGGGLDSSLGGSTNIGGVQNTNKFLDKSAWALAFTLIVLVLFSSLSFSGNSTNESKMLDTNAPTIPTVPAAEPTLGNTPANGEAPAVEVITPEAAE